MLAKLYTESGALCTSITSEPLNSIDLRAESVSSFVVERTGLSVQRGDADMRGPLWLLLLLKKHKNKDKN
jgi:hypothetical protein